MKDKVKKFAKDSLTFLRLTDEGTAKLSITYIACWVVIAKIAIAPEPSIVEMGGLLVVLAAHYSKKHINKGRVKLNQEQTDEIKSIRTKLDTMADKVGAVATTLGFSKKQ